MKKRISDNMWIPFWVDKWIFGSMRIEHTLEERAIWIDLLAVAAKDDGYIRANENTPYPIQQLAGMLIIPEDKLFSAIEKFIETKKLTKLENGVLHVTTWEKYQLSESYERVKRHRKKEKMLQCNEKGVTISNNIKENHIKSNNIIKEKVEDESLFEEKFEEFWKAYPKKVAKDYVREKFMILARKGELTNITKAFAGYMGYLKYQRLEKNFEQEILNPATFLMKNRWRDYIDFKYKPKL